MKKFVCVLITALTVLATSVTGYAQHMYAPDGRTAEISNNEVWKYQSVGWYTYPVMYMYSVDGRTIVVNKYDAWKWENVGWYSYPVSAIYSQNNKSAVVATSSVNDYLALGWYTNYYPNSIVPNFTAVTGSYAQEVTYGDNAIYWYEWDWNNFDNYCYELENTYGYTYMYTYNGDYGYMECYKKYNNYVYVEMNYIYGQICIEVGVEY